jgi:TRAP-type uncharacterized transport system substrate-binding protein
MLTRASLRRITLKWLAPAAGVAALGYACFLYFHSPRPTKHALTFAAGNPLGMRHKLATRLAEEAARRHVALEMRPSAGSDEDLDQVNAREVDVALVQGGLTTEGRSDVRQVATLHIEPLLLLVKKEIHTTATSSLMALRGKTVNLGEAGSGNYLLAAAVLHFAGLDPRDKDPEHGYVPMTLRRQQILAERDDKRLPDAVFLATTLPSPTARHLVAKHGYRLVPLPFAEAFALESLAELPGPDGQGPDDDRIEQARIHATTIPAFTCSVDPPVPEEAIPTLGTRLIVVAHKDVPVSAVYQLVEATYGAEFGRVVHPPLDAKLMDLPPEFPWHEGARVFQHRNSPLLSGAFMDSAHKGMAILAAAASGLFVLWQWLKLKGQIARGKGLNHYITEVTRVEARALAVEGDGPSAVAQWKALHAELCRIKMEAMGEFTGEELAGKELLAGFLVQVHDVRDHLLRLIREAGDTSRGPSYRANGVGDALEASAREESTE